MGIAKWFGELSTDGLSFTLSNLLSYCNFLFALALGPSPGSRVFYNLWSWGVGLLDKDKGTTIIILSHYYALCLSLRVIVISIICASVVKSLFHHHWSCSSHYFEASWHFRLWLLRHKQFLTSIAEIIWSEDIHSFVWKTLLCFGVGWFSCK